MSRDEIATAGSEPRAHRRRSEGHDDVHDDHDQWRQRHHEGHVRRRRADRVSDHPPPRASVPAGHRRADDGGRDAGRRDRRHEHRRTLLHRGTIADIRTDHVRDHAPSTRKLSRAAGRSSRFRDRKARPPLDHALREHRVGHLSEACDVRAVHVVAGLSELLSGVATLLVDAPHDLAQALVDTLARP